ncbi:hypothetical protein pb186bvf_008009, partial [Paramecium bursaria]
MDQTTINPRQCEVNSHEQQPLLPYLCTSLTCNSNSRYFCQLCLLEGLHCHSYQMPQYLSKLNFNQELETQTKSKIQIKPIFEQQENILKIVQEIERITQEFKNYKSQEYLQISQTDENYLECLSQVLKESFFSLTQDNIDKIFHISEYKLSCQKIVTFNNILEQLILKKYDQFDQTLSNIDDKIRKIIYSEEILKDLQGHQIYFNQSQYPLIISFQLQCVKIRRVPQNNQWGDKLYNDVKYAFDLIELSSKKSYKMKFKNAKMDFLQFSIDSKLLYYKE